MNADKTKQEVSEVTKQLSQTKLEKQESARSLSRLLSVHSKPSTPVPNPAGTDKAADDLNLIANEVASLVQEGSELLDKLDSTMADDIEEAGRQSPVGKLAVILAEKQGEAELDSLCEQVVQEARQDEALDVYASLMSDAVVVDAISDLHQVLLCADVALPNLEIVAYTR